MIGNYPPLDILGKINEVNTQIENLKNIIKIVKIEHEPITINGSETFAIEFNIDPPDGYMIAGVLQWNLNNRVNISVTGIGTSVSDNHIVRIWGKSSTTYSFEITPTVSVLLIKNFEEV